MEVKKCSKCKEVKPLDQFYKDKSSKNGFCYKCKDCYKNYYKNNNTKIKKICQKYREINKDKIKEKIKKHREANKNRIKIQAKKYRDNNKDKIKEKAKKYREINKDEIKIQTKKYRDNNKDKIKERAKKYRETNKNEIKLQAKKYREDNKDKIKEYRDNNKGKIKKNNKNYRKNNKNKINKYTKNKLKNDINFKLACSLRNRICFAIKNNYKTGSAVKDLGCSVEELKIYLENKFSNNMSWENYGKVWHIDHILPLTAFNLQDRNHFKAACNYKNLQPLLKEDNLVKGNKYNQEDFDRYLSLFI